nr:CFF_HP1_G0025430.mRNA.1.CDS.1 [Saccharomyces cerevisiae]
MPKCPHWTAFLSMLIGLFYNKTFFGRNWEYLFEQISEVWLLPHIALDLANVEVLAADNTRVPLYMADGSGSQRSWIAMMFQTVDLI